MKEKEENIKEEEESPKKKVVKEVENNIEGNAKIQSINNKTITNNTESQNSLNLLSKNTEFDEIIYFSNYFSVFRKIEFNNPISTESNPYILSREFYILFLSCLECQPSFLHLRHLHLVIQLE